MTRLPSLPRHAVAGVVVGAFVLTLGWSPQAHAGLQDSAQWPSTATRAQVEQVLVDYFQARGSAVVTGATQSKSSVQVAPQQVSVDRRLHADVLAFRDRMKQRRVEFDRFSVQVDHLDVRQHDDALEVSVREVAEVGYRKVRGHEPDHMAYTARHVVVLDRVDGALQVREDRQLDETGVLPRRVATTYLAEEELTRRAALEAHVAASGEVSPLTRVAHTGDALRVTPANAEPGGTPTRSGRDADGYGAEIPAIIKYKRKVMSTYAEKYWKDYNPAYRHWDGQGGDCTNFASQVLRAGGYQDVPGSAETRPRGWWYGEKSQSLSWINVDVLAVWGANTPGRFSPLRDVWDLGPGDLLQVDKDKDGDWEHTMPVSYWADGTPYLTYHSNNIYRRSLEIVLDDWDNTNFFPQDTLEKTRW